MIKRLLFSVVAVVLISSAFAFAPRVKIAGFGKEVAAAPQATERQQEISAAPVTSLECTDPATLKPSFKDAADVDFADLSLVDMYSNEGLGKPVATATLGTASTVVKPLAVNTLGGTPEIVPGTLLSRDMSYNGTRYGYRLTLEETDEAGTYSLSNIYGLGSTVSITIDATTGAVTIPQQKLYDHSTYGEVSIVPLTVNAQGGYVLPKTPLEGTIDSEGTISLGMWGVCVTQRDTVDNELVAGEYFGRLFNIFTESKLSVPNTVVTCNSISADKILMYEVYMDQTQPNEIIFYGLGNLTSTDVLTSRVKPDKQIVISPQTMYTNLFYGPFMNYPAELTLDSSTNSWKVKADSKNPMILTHESDGSYSIPGWVIAAKASPSSYVGYAYADVTIVPDLDITYPQPIPMTMQGAGTEADPYIVTTTTDIDAIAQKTEDGEDFSGVFFSLGNDLDFSAVSATGYVAMGSQTTAFNGRFNGQGHKITNFKADGKGFYSTGFFGVLGSDAVVENLTFEKASVTSSGYNVGIVAAQSAGTIRNVSVENSTVDCNGELGGGIVGEMKGGLVANCSFSGAITTTGSGAGITGEIMNASITDCNVRANITADGSSSAYSNKEIAGIAGTLLRGTVTRCSNSGTLTDGLGYHHVGGIAGYAGSCTIEQCFNVAPISAKRAVIGSATSASDGETYTGGIVGYASAVEMTDCYNTGLIIKTDRSDCVGGLVGYLGVGYQYTSDKPAEMINISPITNCYNAGQILSTSAEAHKGIYGNTFISTSYSGPTPEEACLHNALFDQQINSFEHELYGRSTRQLTSSLPEGFDSNIWKQTAGCYPVLANTADGSEAQELSAVPLTLRENDFSEKVKEYFEVTPGSKTAWALQFDAEAGETATETAALRMEGSKVTVKDKYANSVVTATTADGWGLKMYRLAIVPKIFEGEGTAADPYQLATEQDWLNLDEAVAKYAQQHRGDYFAMMNDIDFAADETLNFRGVGYGTNYEFAGNLDGRNHSVSGLAIDAGVYDETGKATTSSLLYNGLFGVINEDGSVRNVIISADNDLKFYSYGGAIAGLNSGLIENCRNFATIKGMSQYIGGIAGVNYDLGTIRSSYNAGTVQYGVSNAGGITGYNRQTALVELCQNDGDVVNTVVNSVSQKTISNTAGGIVGTSYGSIDRCVNNALVRAYNTVGGIVGQINSYYNEGNVTASVNNGLVQSINEDLKRGAVIGYYSGKGRIADNYFDASINVNGGAYNNGLEGITGLSTSELVSGTPLANLSADDFDFTADGYPVLKAFTSEEASKALRSMYVAFAPKVLRTNVVENTPLSKAEGITYTLLEGTAEAPSAFAIEGGMLAVTKPEGLNMATDSLNITLRDKYLKVMRINAIPEILKGAGIAEDPYLIETPADWNMLSEFMQKSKWEYSGNFFRIANDLDFKGDSIYLLAVDGVNFQGTLDGDGHTIKNYVYENTVTTKTKIVPPNLYLGRYLGVIGTLGNTGTFKNTILDGSLIGASYIAGAVGDNYGTIENIINRGSVYTTSGYASGIASRVFEGGVIRNCENQGSISSKTNYVSGIAHDVKAKATIENCVNNGEVTATTTYATGIAYTVSGGLKNCVNNGKLLALGGSVNGIAYTIGKTGWLDSCVNNSDIDILNLDKPVSTVNGICGTLTARTAAEIGDGAGFVRNCHNHGNLTAKSTVIGAINTINAGWEVSDCSNTGNVAIDPAATSGEAYGFTKKITGNKTTGSEEIDLMSKMVRCFNTGNVTGASAKVAGLAGEAAKYTYIADCYNTGKITCRNTGSLCAAGLVSQHNGVMERSFNTGDVEAWNNAVGGLVGYIASGELDYPAQMLNCFNTGNVTTHYTGTNTNGNAGGLGGYLSTVKDDFPHLIKNCYNTGNVTANQRVGGLFAGAFRPQSRVEDCYNFGKVTCLKPDTQGRYYWSGTTFTNSYTYVLNGDTVLMLSGHRNCYYDKTVNPGSQFRNVVGSAQTTAKLRQLFSNSDFEASDFEGYPVLGIHKDKECTSVGSALLLLATDDETHEKVLGNISLVGPAGAEWTTTDILDDATTTGYADALNGNVASEPTRLKIDGDKAILLNPGKAVITCRYNGMKKDFIVDVDKDAVLSAIDEIFEGKEVKSTQYFDIQGRQVACPAAGQVYIIRTVYTDGTMKVEKKLARE